MPEAGHDSHLGCKAVVFGKQPDARVLGRDLWNVFHTGKVRSRLDISNNPDGGPLMARKKPHRYTPTAAELREPIAVPDSMANLARSLFRGKPKKIWQFEEEAKARQDKRAAH